MDPPTVLLLIIDIHSVSWSISSDPALNVPAVPSKDDGITDTSWVPDTLTLQEAMDQLLVFMNAHLAMRFGNELVVYAAMEGGKS